jgi:tetratricopeptide (TPR) repeat protein
MNNLELAQERYQKGAFSEAADLIAELRIRGPIEVDTELLLGVALARARRNDEATEVLTAVLEKEPNRFEALTWLAVLTQKRGEGQDAMRYAQRAIELRPNDPTGYSALGSCHLYYRRGAEAVKAFKKAASLASNLAEHQHNLGLAYSVLHDHANARQCFSAAIKLAPRNIQSYLALSDDYSMFGSVESRDILIEALRINPNSPALHSAMGLVMTRLNDMKAGEAHLLRAVALSPSAIVPYAAWLVDQGRFTESNAIYEAMRKENPSQGVAYFGVLQSRKISDADAPLIEQMSSLRHNPALGLFEQMHLRYALAKTEEHFEQFEQAMTDYDEANRIAFDIHNAGAQSDNANYCKYNQMVERWFERLDRRQVPAHSTDAPIFIIGMVRSGTTLLEQILSSHPDVEPAGELNFWVKTSIAMAHKPEPTNPSDLAKATESYLRNLKLRTNFTRKFTDKMPLNFANAGVIHAVMPNARLIHVRRHPVDTCLSIYSTYFGLGGGFAYKKSNIVARYREYLRSIAYWRQTVPEDRLLEIDYEELVSNPADLIPRIVEFCGLPWDDACLHPEKNKNLILTPSRWQARQPINRASVERWRRFQPWLGEFAELLNQ